MKTDKEIAAEIEALEACKEYAPRRTMFGDDNHAQIDLQIEFLKGEIDTTSDEFYDMTDDEQSAVLEAEDWRNDAGEPPSSGWDIFKYSNRKKVALKRQGCAGRRQPSPAPKRGKKS